MNEPQTKVKSLYKAIQVLNCFTTAEPELGITELADRLGIYKSSVHNIVSTYEQCGMLTKNPRTGKYHLGLRILELSHVLLHNHDLRQVARPFMAELAARTGETCHLACCLDRQVLYVDTVLPDEAALARSITGLKAPMYCTGLGKAILAFMPEAFIREVMEMGYERFTNDTIMTDADLLADLEAVRARGYSVDQMEHEYGVKCIGVPLLSRERVPLAAISITGPSLRFADETIPALAAEVMQTARQIERML